MCACGCDLAAAKVRFEAEHRASMIGPVKEIAGGVGAPGLLQRMWAKMQRYLVGHTKRIAA